MNKVSWENQYFFWNIDELETEYKGYIDSSWDYKLPYDTGLSKTFVKTPLENILTKKDIEEILSKPLVIGNKEQIEALDAAEFFKISEVFHGEVKLS